MQLTQKTFRTSLNRRSLVSVHGGKKQTFGTKYCPEKQLYKKSSVVFQKAQGLGNMVD
jgi:hypothetical protein